MFKVWSADRQQKRMISAASLQELVQKGKHDYCKALKVIWYVFCMLGRI